jgi:hypothetical protein
MGDDEFYHAKYLKYKLKYLTLKDEMEGGDDDKKKSKKEQLKAEYEKAKSKLKTKIESARAKLSSKPSASKPYQTVAIKPAEITSLPVPSKEIINPNDFKIIFTYECRIPWGKEGVFMSQNLQDKNKFIPLTASREDLYLNMLRARTPIFINMNKFIPYVDNKDIDNYDTDLYRLTFFGAVGSSDIKIINNWSSVQVQNFFNLNQKISADENSYKEFLSGLNESLKKFHEGGRCKTYYPSLCQDECNPEPIGRCPGCSPNNSPQLDTILILSPFDKQKTIYQLINIISK